MYTKPEVTNQHFSSNHPLRIHGMEKVIPAMSICCLVFRTLSSFALPLHSFLPALLSITHSQALASLSSKVRNVVKKVEQERTHDEAR